MDILTGENEWLILLANIDFRYWSVGSSSKSGGDGWGNIVILASCEHQFIRVHENVVQNPSNNNTYIH